MTNLIKASELTQETVATLPEQVTAYARHSRMMTTWCLRTEEPCEGSILRKSVGDKVAVFLNDLNQTIAIGTIKKVNKTTVRVEYTLPNTGNVYEITVNEDGTLRNQGLCVKTEVRNYLEGHFEQMVELETYRKVRTYETNVARQEATKLLKEALGRSRHMSLEDSQAIIDLLRK